MPFIIYSGANIECLEICGTRIIRKRTWDSSTKGMSAQRLILMVDTWVKGLQGEVTFHPIQVLSGHGSFKQYVHHFGPAGSSECPVCTDFEEIV